MVERIAHNIERLVGADVHRAERPLVRLFFLNLFLLLTAYYILKVVREPLILLGDGAVSRSYARGLQAFLLIVLVPLYSRLANRVEPSQLVSWVNVFFIASLVFFIGLGTAGYRIGFAFFVWLGIFSTVAIAQFWSLANDVLTEAEGKRLFPLIAVGGTLGGIFGSQIAARGMERLGTLQLMVVAAVLLSGCLLLTQAGRRTGEAYRNDTPREEPPPERDPRSGFTLVVRDRYLLLIALSILLLNLINTTGDYVLAEMVETYASSLGRGLPDPEALRERMIGEFYGNYQTAITSLTALIQIALVARLFKKIGVSSSLLLLPLFVFAGYGASAVLPMLALVATVKIMENSADYSLQNTLQQTLFLPTSRDVKYKAKTAIDTFVVRAGDLASASLVAVGVHLALGVRGFAAANAGLGVLWLAVAWQIGRRYRQLSRGIETPEPIDAKTDWPRLHGRTQDVRRGSTRGRGGGRRAS
jgi:AAA family ATP:ADP antiporter